MTLHIIGPHYGDYSMDYGADNQDTRATQSIRKLWSTEDAVRGEGKRELIALGPAREPLTALLRDLMNCRHPRFPTGMEEEGNQLLESYKATQETTLPVDRMFAAGQPYIERLARISINSRLISDTIELLGEVGAAQAVPMLIEFLESELETPDEPLVTPQVEMRALRQIGAQSVPMLIEAIEHYQAHAENATRRPLGFVISLSESPDDQCIPEHPPALVEIDVQKADESPKTTDTARRIIARAAVLLAELGDERALPVLEKALTLDEDKTLRKYIEDAISTIRGRKR